MLDTRRSIEAPEGVELVLRIAGPVVRFAAWFIDVLIRSVFYVILTMILPIFGDFGVGILLILFFVVEWFYPVLFEIYRQGATPGKKSMGIRVMHDDGTEIGWQASLIRNLLRSVDFLPLLYGFGLVSMLLNRDFKRLGDITAGTLVVYTDKPVEAADIPETRPLAPPVPLTTFEQRAIIQFAERAAKLTTQRQNELAATLENLTGKTGEQGTQRLMRYANWMVGRR